MTSAFHQAIDWKRYGEIEKGSMAFGLTINGACASNGAREMHMMLKSLIITKRGLR
jgi:hypothetical protein